MVTYRRCTIVMVALVILSLEGRDSGRIARAVPAPAGLEQAVAPMASPATPVLGRGGFIGGGGIRDAVPHGLWRHAPYGSWVIALHGNVVRLLDPGSSGPDVEQLGAVRLSHMADTLAVDGPWAYAYGDGVVSVIDASVPGAPRLTSRLDLRDVVGPKTFPGDPDPYFYPGVAAWAGHVYVALDRTTPTTVGQETAQLYGLERDPSGHLREVSRIEIGATPMTLHGDGPRLLVLQRSQSLVRRTSHYVRVYDLHEPSQPRRIELLGSEGTAERRWTVEPVATIAGRTVIPPDGMVRELVVVADREARELIVWDLAGDPAQGERRPVARMTLPGVPSGTIFMDSAYLWLGLVGTVGEDGSKTPRLLRIILQRPSPIISGQMFDSPPEPLLGSANHRFLFGGRSGRLWMASTAHYATPGTATDLFYDFESYAGIPAIHAASVDGDLAVYAAGDLPGSAHVGIVDLSPVYGPRIVARLPAGGTVTALSLRGRQLLVAGALEGGAALHTLHVLRALGPERPWRIALPWGSTGR